MKRSEGTWVISLRTLKYALLFFAFIPPEVISESTVFNLLQAAIKYTACFLIGCRLIKNRTLQKEFYILCGYYALLLLSTILNIHEADLLQAVLISVGNLCFAYMIISDMRQDQQRFLNALNRYIAILLTINLFVRLFSVLRGEDGSYIAFVSSVNHQGFFYLFSAFIYCLCTDNRRKHDPVLVLLLLNLIVSSGTTLKVLVIIFLLVHFSAFSIKHIRLNAKIIFVALIALFFAVVVFRVQEKIIYSEALKAILGDLNTFTGRNQIWSYTLKKFAERPHWLLGYGQIAGSFVPASVITWWSSEMLGTHNDFLNKLYLAGPLAIILWCVFIYRGFVLLPHEKGRLRRDCMTLMVCMVVQLIMDNSNTELMAPMIFIISNLRVSKEENITQPYDIDKRDSMYAFPE